MEEKMEHHLKNIHISATNIISSLGFTTKENVDAICCGKSGIKSIEKGIISDNTILAGLIDTIRLTEMINKYKLDNFSKVEQLVILSIKDILLQKHINLKECGLIISTTKGNIDLLSNHTDKICDDISLKKTASKISAYFDMKDDAMIVSNACISGVSALIIAKRLLQAGHYENILVVGVDIRSHFITSGFQSFRSLSEEICKPYDSERDGLNLGEACGTILLSTLKEPDSILLTGGAISNDANHISGPSRTGDGLHYAIAGALDDANITTKDVGFINLHGTATVFNDEMEAKALHLSQLSNAPVNSLKPYFGHTLGASGIIETIICAEQLQANIILGTPGYKTNGVSQSLNIKCSNTLSDNVNTCIKTASGFGGCNAAIVLSKISKPLKDTTKDFSFTEIKSCEIENNTITINKETVFSSDAANFYTFIREAYKNTDDSNQKFYKMDDLCKLGYIAAYYLLEGESFNPTETGIILSNFSSSLDTDVKHQQIIENQGDEAASPATFVYTLANIVAGEICIRHKIQGENTFFIEYEDNSDKQKEYVKLAMINGKLDLCITGWCEYFDNKYKVELRLIQKKELWKN